MPKMRRSYIGLNETTSPNNQDRVLIDDTTAGELKYVQKQNLSPIYTQSPLIITVSNESWGDHPATEAGLLAAIAAANPKPVGKGSPPVYTEIRIFSDVGITVNTNITFTTNILFSAGNNESSPTYNISDNARQALDFNGVFDTGSSNDIVFRGMYISSESTGATFQGAGTWKFDKCIIDDQNLNGITITNTIVNYVSTRVLGVNHLIPSNGSDTLEASIHTDCLVQAIGPNQNIFNSASPASTQNTSNIRVIGSPEIIVDHSTGQKFVHPSIPVGANVNIDFRGIPVVSDSNNTFVDGLIGVTGGAFLFYTEADTDKLFRVDAGGKTEITGDYLPLSGGSVTGNVDISGELLIGNNSVSALSEKLNVTGNGIVTEATDGGITGMFGTFGGSDVLYGSFSNNKVNIRANNVNALTIDTSQNVGIGTTAPDERLHVHVTGSGNSQVAFTNDTTGLTTEFLVGINSSEQAIVFNENNSDMLFGTNNTTQMRLDSLGRLGIGNTPTEALDVTGNVKVSGTSTATSYNGVVLTTAGSATNFLNEQGNYVAVAAGASDFDSLTDTPANKTGSANRFVKVNGGETALEYVSATYVEAGDSPTWTGTHTFNNPIRTSQVQLGDGTGTNPVINFAANAIDFRFGATDKMRLISGLGLFVDDNIVNSTTYNSGSNNLVLRRNATDKLTINAGDITLADGLITNSVTSKASTDLTLSGGANADILLDGHTDNDIKLRTAGVERMKANSGGITVTGSVTAGTVSAPTGNTLTLDSDDASIVMNGTADTMDLKIQSTDVIKLSGTSITHKLNTSLVRDGAKMLVENTSSSLTGELEVLHNSTTDVSIALTAAESPFKGTLEYRIANVKEWEFVFEADSLRLNRYTTFPSFEQPLRIQADDVTWDGILRHDFDNAALNDVGSINGTATVDLEVNAPTGQSALIQVNAVTKLDVNNDEVRSDVPVGLKSYTVGALPTTNIGAGAMAYASDEVGGAVPVFYDGTNWRRVTDRAIAST